MNENLMNIFILFMIDCFWGTSGTGTKVINGRRANFGEFPATVCMRGLIRCGGTLLTLDTVITAGHCFFRSGKKINPVDFYIIGGIVDLKDDSGFMQVSSLRDYVVHDKFELRDYSFGDYSLHDIGLGFLVEPFLETKTLKPARFPASDPAGMKRYIDKMKTDPNTTCHGTGFGLTSFKLRQLSRYLKVATLKFLPDDVLNTYPELKDFEVWTTSTDTDDETSFGDSGSTFLCGGKIVGAVKGGLFVPKDDKNITVLSFTLFGPYFNDLIFPENQGCPNFDVHPPVLVFFLITLSFLNTNMMTPIVLE